MRSLTGAAIAVSLVLTAPTAAGAASYDSSGVFARSATAAGTATATAAAPGERLELLLALRADDAGLERYATAVGTPGSPLFRRYLEPGQIARRFGAPRADQQAVIRRLRASGISGRPGLGGFWIEASAGVAQAQRLFSTDLKAFRATNGTRFVAPVTNPSLPAGLRGLVIGVIGLDTAPVLSASSARSGQTALVPPTPAQNAVIDAKMRALGSSLRGNSGTQRGCAAARQHGTPIGDGLLIPAHTPNQYLHAYGFDILHRRNIVGQGQRIAVIEIDGFKRSDLTAAARCFGHRAPPTPITRVGIKRNLSPGAETTLDLQVISAAAPGLKEIQVIQGANTSSAFVSQYARTLALPASKRPSVISASVGECEWNLAAAPPPPTSARWTAR